jgi:N6-adenosine-specific RNA methylase IME4
MTAAIGISPELAAPDAFASLTPGHHGAIAADPPWTFYVRSSNGEGRSASQHYRTMGLEALLQLPVASLASSDAWLFLWSTGPHLPQALRLLERWGFSYSGFGFVWVKTNPTEDGALLLDPIRSFHVGMGYTTRHNAELCLLGRRGSPKRLRKDVRELIIAPRREHSRKPAEFYERVRQLVAGPYLELFARESRPGWERWGDETTKFDER